MIINTAFKDDEDLDLLQNTIDAIVPGVIHNLGNDYGAQIGSVMLRAKAAIYELEKMIKDKQGGDPYS